MTTWTYAYPLSKHLTQRLTCIALAGLWLGACSPDPAPEIEPVEGFEPDAAVLPPSDARDAGDDAGIPDGSVEEMPVRDPEPIAFGVVATDGNETSVSLLRPDGTVLRADFIDSGSATAGLVTALSGDVALPTRSGDPRTLTLLDRFRTDVLTRVDPATGTVLGQVKTHTPNAENDDIAYSSNPQDFILVDADNAWITRFGPKVGASASDPDRGNDLLHIDPTRFERGRRIDLSSLNGLATRTSSEGATEEVTVYARPSRMVRLGQHLVVGLARQSQTYDAIGSGMLALVDLTTEQVEGIELPDLKNCTSVVPVPDAPMHVAVACFGFFRGVPRDHAGVAILRLEDGQLQIEHIWRAAEHPSAALSVSGLVALSTHEVVVVETGARQQSDESGNVISPATHDKMYQLDVADGTQQLLFEGQGRFRVGDGAYNARQRILLVPDGSTDTDGRPTAGVRRFRRTEDGALEALDVIAIDPDLRVREIRPL